MVPNEQTVSHIHNFWLMFLVYLKSEIKLLHMGDLLFKLFSETNRFANLPRKAYFHAPELTTFHLRFLG